MSEGRGGKRESERERERERERSRQAGRHISSQAVSQGVPAAIKPASQTEREQTAALDQTTTSQRPFIFGNLDSRPPT